MHRVVWCAFALLLAGCATEPVEPVIPPPEPLADDDIVGQVRCVVVDANIVPIPNATVRLVQPDVRVLTDAEGNCRWPNDIPRPYTVEVTAPGYLSLRLDVTEAMGPDTLRFVLESDPGVVPFTTEQVYNGMVACSARLPTGGFNDGCGLFGNAGLGSTQRVTVELEQGNLDWVQTELAWTPNGPTSQTLCTRGKEADLYPIGDVCGAPNIVRILDDVQIAADAIDRGQWFEYIVFPDHLEPIGNGTGNVVVQQNFQLFVHGFYNQQPEAGWIFTRDGSP